VEDDEGVLDPFVEHRDRELVRLGVPKELMPLVRSIRTEKQFEEL